MTLRPTASAKDLRLLHVQTDNGAYPSSYPMGTGGSFAGRYDARSVKLTTNLRLLPRPRKRVLMGQRLLSTATSLLFKLKRFICGSVGTVHPCSQVTLRPSPHDVTGHTVHHPSCSCHAEFDLFLR
jgi:hypothetical protein